MESPTESFIARTIDMAKGEYSLAINEDTAFRWVKNVSDYVDVLRGIERMGVMQSPSSKSLEGGGEVEKGADNTSVLDKAQFVA